MADYFTHFSIIVSLPDEAAEKYDLHLAEQARQLHQDEQKPEDFPTDLLDVVEDWQFDTDVCDPTSGSGIWIHTDSGGVDAACSFIQHLLQRFNPTGHVTLEWSNDCSKPRLDAFGGGAALITADKVTSINTTQWLHRQVSRLQKHKQ